jgi:hypothetical protein
MGFKKTQFLLASGLLIPSGAIALPREGGTHQCGCLCNVVLGDGTKAVIVTNFNLPSQYACYSATGDTCNVSDPTTGGVSTGYLEGCGDGFFKNTVHAPPTAVFHPPLRGINAPPQR